jgi:hypothetical protein
MALMPTPPSGPVIIGNTVGDVLGTYANVMQVLGIPGIIQLLKGPDLFQKDALDALNQLQQQDSDILTEISDALRSLKHQFMTDNLSTALDQLRDILNKSAGVITDPHSYQTPAENVVGYPLNFPADVFYRPFIHATVFSPQDSPDKGYVYDTGAETDTVTRGDLGREQRNLVSSVGWYGDRNPRIFAGGSADSTGGDLSSEADGQYVIDAQYTLRLWLAGIAAWLLTNDLVQLDFAAWLDDTKGTFLSLADSLSRWHEALTAEIGRSDIPTADDFIQAFACTLTWIGLTDSAVQAVDDPYQNNGVLPMRDRSPGTPWNGIYGVLDKTADYKQGEVVPVQASTHRVAFFDYQYLSPMFSGDVGAGTWYLDQFDWDYLRNVTYPWVMTRLNLAIEFQWKEVYLSCGYHQVWSIVQNLRVLGGRRDLVERDDENAEWSTRKIALALGAVAAYLDFEWFSSPTDSDQTGFYLSSINEALERLAKATATVEPDRVAGVGARPSGLRYWLSQHRDDLPPPPWPPG